MGARDVDEGVRAYRHDARHATDRRGMRAARRGAWLDRAAQALDRLDEDAEWFACEHPVAWALLVCGCVCCVLQALGLVNLDWMHATEWWPR